MDKNPECNIKPDYENRTFHLRNATPQYKKE